MHAHFGRIPSAMHHDAGFLHGTRNRLDRPREIGVLCSLTLTQPLSVYAVSHDYPPLPNRPPKNAVPCGRQQLLPQGTWRWRGQGRLQCNTKYYFIIRWSALILR
jgi:hypothetical protein